MITVGVDEVGRGCWAGPLVAGAVALETTTDLSDCPVRVRDSKKMSSRQREIAAQWLKERSISVGIGWVWPAEIDAWGVTKAVRVAMERAVAGITIDYQELIVDGNINYFPNNSRALAVIKADDSVPTVSAASIIAKVARDTYMSGLGNDYEMYGFSSHVGYGTASHIAALKQYGVSDIHRKSYKPIKALLV